MAGTAIEGIKKSIGRGSEEMICRYAHLRPDFVILGETNSPECLIRS
jgi:hypothetical protein